MPSITREWLKPSLLRYRRDFSILISVACLLVRLSVPLLLPLLNRIILHILRDCLTCGPVHINLNFGLASLQLTRSHRTLSHISQASKLWIALHIKFKFVAYFAALIKLKINAKSEWNSEKKKKKKRKAENGSGGKTTNSSTMQSPQSMLFGLMKRPSPQHQQLISPKKNLWKLFRGSHKFNQHQI